MVTDDLGNQSQPETSTVGLGGDKGIKKIRQHVVWHAWPIVGDRYFKWQTDLAGAAGHGKVDARPECGLKTNLLILLSGNGFRSIFYKIDEDL